MLITPSGIPEAYKKDWVPCRNGKILLHVTTYQNYLGILKAGRIEPHDPFPQQWAGLPGVFLSDPTDSQFSKSLNMLQEQTTGKHERLVGLYIRTTNTLYKCVAKGRTSQRVSLAPILIKEVRSASDFPFAVPSQLAKRPSSIPGSDTT